jgi:hypothetical protein
MVEVMVEEGLGELDLKQFLSGRDLFKLGLSATAETAWDHRGNIAGALLGVGVVSLANAGPAFAQDGGPGGENIVGPLGKVGIWLSKVVERAAKNPLEVIVPMFGIGLSYGTGQAIWKTIWRKAPVPPEQNPAFQQILKVASQAGLELEDTRQKKALADTFAAFRMLPSGGEQAPFHEDLWEEVKELAPEEAREWTSAGVWLYVALNLMESTSRMPVDTPGKYAQYLVIAIAAGFALRELKKAVTPSKK